MDKPGCRSRDTFTLSCWIDERSPAAHLVFILTTSLALHALWQVRSPTSVLSATRRSALRRPWWSTWWSTQTLDLSRAPTAAPHSRGRTSSSTMWTMCTVAHGCLSRPPSLRSRWHQMRTAPTPSLTWSQRLPLRTFACPSLWFPSRWEEEVKENQVTGGPRLFPARLMASQAFRLLDDSSSSSIRTLATKAPLTWRFWRSTPWTLSPPTWSTPWGPIRCWTPESPIWAHCSD